MRLYHGTSVKNVESIKRSGLVSKFEGVYLTDSIDSACRWTLMRVSDEHQLAVVEVEVTDKNLVDGNDHSQAMVDIFGVGKSILSTKAIPKSYIKKIHYFKF